MGFFDFLSSPTQDPALSVNGEGKKKKTPWVPETAEERDPLEDALSLDKDYSIDREKNVTKLKVQKAHLDIQSAFGDAVKALDEAQVKQSYSPEFSVGAMDYGRGARETAGHLKSVRDRAGARKADPSSTLKLADDIQELGNRLKDPKLIGAAQKLMRASQAQAELEELKKPGGALAIDPKEVEARKAKLGQRQQQLQRELQTAGEIRTPQLQKELKETTDELRRITPPPQAQPEPPVSEPAPPGTKGPVTSYMDGLGIDEKALVDRLRQSMNIVGIPNEKWGDPVDPKAGLLRVLGALDPSGDKFVRILAQEMAAAKAQDQQSASASPSKGAAGGEESGMVAETQGRIQSKEQELKALYAQLSQSQFMHTWPGIILYVLVGMLTQNPAFAARLIGGVGNRDAIDREAKQLQFDLRRLDHELARRENTERYARKEALSRIAKRDEVKDERLWELGKMMLNHKLIIDRNEKRGNADTSIMKKLSGDFNRATAMASKFSGTMNNILESEEARAAAKRNFEFYMRRAAELDAELRDIGGVVEEEAVETQE